MQVRCGLLAVAAVLLAACFPGGEAGPGSADAAFDAGEVALGAALSEIRAELAVSQQLQRAGDVEGALAHATHATEAVRPIRDHLRRRNVSYLQVSLDQPRSVLSQRGTSGVTDAYDDGLSAVESVEESELGDLRRSAAYRASVVATMLAEVADEYERALGPNEIRSVAEYQDAHALFVEARRLYDGIRAAVEEASAEHADAIDDAFATLASALPALQAPAQPFDAAMVERAAALVATTLEDSVNALPVGEPDPQPS